LPVACVSDLAALRVGEWKGNGWEGKEEISSEKDRRGRGEEREGEGRKEECTR